MQLPLTQRGLVVFIDPGQTGAAVALNLLGQPVAWLRAEEEGSYYEGKVIAGGRLAAWLHGLPTEEQGPIHRVAIEVQSTRPREAATAALTTGKAWGVLLGVVQALGLPLVEVAPQKWATAMHGRGCKTSDARKKRSIRMAEQEVPGIPLVWGRRTKPHDGLADAICGALWLRSYVLQGG